MAELLYATSHLAGDFLNPANAVGNTPATWAGDLNSNTNYTSRWAIDDPIDPLTSAATQTIRVVARKGTNSGTPTIALNLYENGVLVQSILAATNITSTTGQTLVGTFNTSAVGNRNNVEIEVVQTSAGGNPSTRNCAQVSHIEWTADTTPAGTLHELSGSIAGAGTVGGGLVIRRVLSGAVAAAGTLNGNLIPRRALNGPIAGSGSLMGSLVAIRNLTGQLTGTGVLNGNLEIPTGAHELTGQLVGAAALGGTLSRRLVLTGQVTGTATLAGSIIARRSLIGQIAGAGSLTGVLDIPSTAHPLSGSIAGISSLGGELTHRHALEGQLTATANLDGTLIAIRDLTGALLGVGTLGTLNGGLLATHNMAGDIEGEAVLSGLLTIPTVLTYNVAVTIGELEPGWVMGGLDVRWDVGRLEIQ